MVPPSDLPDGEERDDETVHRAQVAKSLVALQSFAERYMPLFTRSEQGAHMTVYVEGLLGGIERKSIEPIATAHGLYRRPLQHFVGAGRWNDGCVRAEMQRHITEEIGSSTGILVIDGCAFPKKGDDSVGVGRQWCGRYGKVDNCQIGVFAAYVTERGAALVDGQLYLPESWIEDGAKRAKTHVPPSVEFRTRWEIAGELIDSLKKIPHAWIVGDEEFGRPSEFRDILADTGERYLLEIPSNTLVRKPPSWPGRGSKWTSVRVRRKHRRDWERVRVRDGEKGPAEVEAFCTRVETRREHGSREETLLIVRNVLRTKMWYFLAPAGVPLDAKYLATIAAQRHLVEEVFEAAKGEVGFDHYEVRSWVGWHHHITLSMLAQWFLVLERRRLGKKLLRSPSHWFA